MARVMNCSLFVKNGPNFAGLGEGGAGYASFTIASRTGEGMRRARTFTRERRRTRVDYFRIIWRFAQGFPAAAPRAHWKTV